MKKIFLGFLLCSLILFNGMIFSVTASNLKIMTENFAPLNYEKDGKLQGIAVDLIGLMLKEMNSKLTVKDIQVLPWARGYKIALNEKNTCLFSTTRTKARENLFKWVGPIYQIKEGILAKKERNIKIKELKDILKYKTGTIIEDVGEQLLTENGIPLKSLERVGGTGAVDNSLKKLAAGRIDLFTYDELGSKWEMKILNIKPNDYEMVYILSTADLYYAFNKNTPDSIIKEFQNALDKLKKDGSYQKIVDKYLK
ncbi:amino acid ABC transporter substrate-binding protein [Tepiditoga spiralis]|uniref:Amino acid ABC transporter substrate-binding protein n=1 Tax=Tepiditoga spiralis TaxID=2108365 RepID=A0A7G1G4N5_9BACT|nr:ABC transporter substrate-binding protein [Tepiditoga spiralis]BBE31075.1 amino acid ABC transporter substrate-binding protein [Tepiditoga spiralis]